MAKKTKLYSPDGKRIRYASGQLEEEFRSLGYTTEPPKPKTTAQPTSQQQQPARAQQTQRTAGQGGRSELRNVFGEENMGALQFGNRVPASRQPGSGVLKPETTRERFDRMLNEQRQFGTRAVRRMQGRPTDAADYPYVERGGKKYRKMTGNRFSVGRDDVFVPDEQAQEVIDAVNEAYDERAQKTQKSRLAQAQERLHANNELIEELRKKRDAHAANVGGSAHFQFSSPGVSPMSTYGGNSAELHEASSYSSAISQLERENEMLNAVIERKGVLGGMGDALFSADTALFGLPELSESLALRRIKDKIDRGEGLTEGERALFEAGSHKAAGESLYGDMLSNGYRWGQVAGYSVPFAAEMLLTGGGLTALRAGLRLATKGAAKIAAKGLAGNIGRGLVKGLGVTADEIGQSAILANTLGAGRTWADIERRNAGTPMGYDEQGNPVFEGGKSRARSIWEGQGAATLERYSEKLGNHMHLIGDAAKWGGKKISGSRGAQWLSGKVDEMRGSRVGKMYSRMSNSDVAQAAKWLSNKMNFNGYIPEVLEEEANIVMNSLLVGDNQLSDLVDKETQLDIWGGMAVTSGFLGGANLAMGGLYSAANRAHRRNVKNQLRNADLVAGLRLTDYRWRGLRERIDNATFEETPLILSEVLASDEYATEEKRAVMQYAEALSKFRGLNLSENAIANGGGASPMDAEAYAHRLAGAEATAEERAAIRSRSEAAAARVKSEFGISDDVDLEDWLKTYGETRGEQMQNLFPDEATPQDNADVKMVLDYINARETYEGMLEGVEDATEAAVLRSNMIVSDNTAPDGNIYMGATRGGNPVYVVSGMPDGATTVVVRDAATGEIQQLPASDVEMNGQIMNGEEFRAREEARIREEAAAAADASILGAPMFNDGDVYEGIDESGQTYTLTINQNFGDGTAEITHSDYGTQRVKLDALGDLQADMDRARAVRMSMEEEAEEAAEGTSVAAPAAQANTPAHRQGDMVEARMPGGTVRGEIFEVSDEDGAPVYSVQWESPVQGVMVGRYSGEELSALQPAAEPENVAAELRSSEETDENDGRVEVYIIDPRDMSDEERAKRGDWLRDAPAIDVEEGTIVSTSELSARKAAEKWWMENVPEPVFYDTEAGEVEISKKSIENSLAHRYGQPKLDAITSLVEGFENAVYLGTMQDGTRDGNVQNHYFAYPINYKGERCYVFCRAMQDANKNRLYVHEVFIAENIKKGDTLQTAASQPHGGIALYRDILANVLDASTSSASKDTPQSVSVQENEQKSLQPIPTRTTKKGTEVLYHEVPVARTLEELYDGTLTQPEVDAFVSANVDESRKQAEKTESTPPKMGTDLAAYKQAKAEWQAKVNEARRKADYWLEVQAEVQRITSRQNESASRSIESASRSIERASRFTEMPTSMSEAQDGAEYAAMAFAGKMGLRITPESFRGETGLGSAEQRQLTGVIATAENGGITIEQAAEWLYAAQENDGVLFYADETEARDAIIDVLSQGNPKGYVARSRKEADKRDSQAEAADKEAWAQQHFQMSFEEYQAMEEQAIPAIIEHYRGFDETTYYANLADNYEQQNERRNDTEKDSAADSAAESAGIGRSGELLQGEQPASTGGTRHIGDGQQGRAAASDVQGGVSAEDASGTSGGGKPDNVRRLETRREQIAEAPTIGEQIQAAEAEVNTNPTEAQKEAGNYKKGHVQIGTFNVTIEQPKGSVRSGVDADGKKWETEMQNTYGYIRGTEGVDGDHIDVFLANDMDAWNGEGVFVVDQYNEDDTFDEHKVMLGFNSIEEAQTAYLNNYEDGWAENHKIVITGTNVADFEKWINSSHRKTKAFAEYKSVKTTEGQSASAERRNLAEAPVKAETPTISQESEQVSDQDNAPYTIAPAQYTTKKGKVIDMHLVKFAGTLTKEQQRAAKELAKAEKGWYDREQGGFMMRSEESAKQLADTILNNDDAVSDAQPVSMIDIQALNNGDVLFTEPQQPKEQPKDEEYHPIWQYSIHIDADGYTTISRDDVSSGYPIGDARFRYSTDSPEEMLDILRNPLNGMQEALEAVGVTLENKIKTRELDRKIKEEREQKRAELRTNGVNGFKIGDKVIYTPASGTRKAINATIHDFEEFGENKPVLDVGLAPVMYEVVEWSDIAKVESSKTALLDDEGAADDKTLALSAIGKTFTRMGETESGKPYEETLTFTGHKGGYITAEMNTVGYGGSVKMNVAEAAEALRNGRWQEKIATESKNEGQFGLVSDERMAELKDRLRKKLGGQMNIGIDPEILAIGLEIAVGHLDRGVKTFTDFAKVMISDLGDVIRPYLKAFYNGARNLPEVVENGLASDMTSYDEVQSFDVANFDKQGIDAFAIAETVTREAEVAQEVEVAQKRIKKVRKTKNYNKNSINSQQEQLNLFDNGREENTAADNSGTQLGRKELPNTKQVGAGVSVQDTARDSKRKRRNTGVRSSESGNGPRYDVNRDYSNEEIEQIVSSVTDIVDGKVVITDEVTDDIKAIARGYESGGIAKKGRGILDEYYTDGKIVDAVNMLIVPYFNSSTPIRVLEPSIGIGNFIQAVNNIPTLEVVAFEINETTARIAKILYPDVDVNLRSFETEFIDESGNKKPLPQKYSLVIGNPPYGSHRGLYKGLGEESKISRYEDYFVKRSLDVLDEGGVLAMVLPSSWIDRHTKFGGYTIERAYRLPSGAFEATQVGTDIVILRKDNKVPVMERTPYFEQFPERVLGEVKERTGRYGRTEEFVEGDIDAAIEAIKKENAEQLADLLDIEKSNDALNNIESAIDETGSTEKAVDVVKDAQNSEKADNKPATKLSGKQDKYKVELNRGAETVPTSSQFTHEFSEGEVEAFADTDYEGTLSNPTKHKRYANYIGGSAVHDFYYAEGDIYSKLALLEQDKRYIVENYGAEQYEKQKALLESVLPKQKSLDEITISPNTAFVKNLNILTDGERVSLKDMFVDFCRKLPYQAFGSSSAWEVIGYVNNEQVHGTDKQRNQLVRERRKRAANDLFNKFLNEELSDNAKKQVVAAFNREYNSTYRPDYSKVPMFSTINRDFKGKPLKLTSVQLAGIGRMTVKGVGVLAHEVGFGKTLSGILAMHEAITRGFAKKPLIVVPNDNILKQWVETIGEVLPSATVNTLGNLGAGYDLTDFKVNDGEFTIITYEGLKAMSFSDGTYNHLASKFSYITEDLNKHQSERDIQKNIEKKNELKGKMKRGTKASYMFENFGFDWLTVDEVHNANHIVSKVRLDKSVASDFRSQSQRTSDLGLKTWLAAQYIQEENNGRNVLLLSATPFTNKPLEYYSVLSLVGNDMLERKGFFNVDQFFATFMEADNELEIGANGRPVQKTNVRRFRNNGLFQQLLSEFIDIKGEEDNPELVRPERLNKEYKIAQNKLTTEAMAAAQELLSDNDTVLQGIGHARAAAFSPYATSLLGMQPKNHKEFVKNSPKIDATIKMIEQNIKDRPDAGQIIYSEVGVEYFPLIRDYLVKESGLKPSEVRIITGATSNNERVNIQSAFNNGEVKVVVGSPAIKEGLNLQGNTTDMYILSLPWNFTQLRQIEGRGWRQGNKWENIRINYMLTNDSVDVFMLQRLQVKQGLYNEAMKSGAESLDVSDIDTAELKTALITDPSVRAEIVTKQEEEKLRQEKTQIEADLSFVTRKYEAYNKLISNLNSQKGVVAMYREYAKNGDTFWADRVKNQEETLERIKNEIEREKENLRKKGVNVDDIERQTTQAQQSIDDIQKKIDSLSDYQQELTEKYQRESEAKAEGQGNTLSTYIQERKEENNSGFYKIRPKEGEVRKEDEDTLYRSDEADMLSDVNERFNEQLEAFTEENADSVVFDLGTPSVVLQSAGVADKPMKLYGSKVAKKMRKHGFSASELRDLPQAIADPIAVFNNYNEDGNRSILTELRTEQGNFLVTLSVGKGQDVDFNIVSSVFGKGDNNVVNWLNSGFATYINKEKALNYLHLATPIVAASNNQELVSAANVIENFENPQVLDVKNDEDVRYRFQSGMYQDELFDALNEHAEYYNAGPANLISALEEYFGGELVSASSGARHAIEISGLVPVPGGKYSGENEEYHHFEFKGQDGETFVESVPFVKPEDVSERGIIFREGEGLLTDEAVSMENDPVSKWLGKARGTAKQRREFAERERKRMAERVQSLAKKLHLDNVEVVTDASQLEGKKQRAKGFYSKSMGKITIVIPNHTSAFDVEQTLLHEAVAHYGLRRLFGEHFDTFLDNVYQSADRAIRERINTIASKNGWNFRTATEEYLASLAEDTNFENRNAGWWSKIKSLFLGMLHKIGFEDFTGVTLTDNELRYILWRSYENLAEPGRYRSILGEAADVAKQHELKVGNYAVSEVRTDVAAEDQAENIEAVNARFNAELEAFKTKTHKGLLHLGRPSEILRVSGVNAENMTLSPSVLHQHLKKHNLSADDIKNLPKSLQSPILVYKHGLTKPNIVVVTEMEAKGGKISISLKLDSDGNVVEVDNVRSVHSKDATRELERLSLLPIDTLKNNLKWVDKEKVSDWLGLPYVGERQDENPKLVSAANVIENFENPQVLDVKNDEEAVLFRLSDEAREARKKARMAEEAAQSVHEAAAEQYEEAVKSVAGKNQFAWMWNAVKDPKAFRNDFAEAYLDVTRSVKQLQDAIEKSYGEKLKAFENVWWALNRKSSVDAIEMERTQRDFIAPLTEALGKLIKTSRRGIKDYKEAVADVEVYLNAVHGLERNLHMAKRNARNKMIKGYEADGMKLSDAVAKADAEIAAMEAKGEKWWSDERRDYSGFTEIFGEKGEKLSIEELEERAQDFIDEFEDETGAAERDALWATIKALNNQTLKKSFECGLISREQYEGTRDMYEHYVPLRGFKNASADIYDYVTRGANSNTLQRIIKKAKGRTSQTTDIFGTMVAMANSAITSGNKNRVAQHFYIMAVNHPTPLLTVSEVWYEEGADGVIRPLTASSRITNDMTMEERADAIAQFDEEMREAEAAGKVFRLKHKKGEKFGLKLTHWEEQEHCVRVMLNGAEYVIFVNGNPKAAQAINGMLNSDLNYNMVGEQFRRYMAFRAKTQTSLSPEFIVSNFERDMNTIVASQFAKRGAKFASKVAKNYSRLSFGVEGRRGGIFSLISKWRKGTLDPNDKVHVRFMEFVNNGGITGISQMYNINELQMSIIKKAKRSTDRNVPAAVGEWLSGGVEYLNLGIENVGRFAVFMACRESGMSLEESIFEAKEASVNFNMRGSGAMGNAWFRKYILYSNVSFQALRQQGTLAAVSALRFGIGLVAAPIISGYLYNMLIDALFADDDDDNPYYGLSEYNRYNYLNVPMINLKTFRPTGNFVKFAVSQEQRGLYAIGQIIYDLSTGRISEERAAMNILTQLNNYSPASFVDGNPEVYEDNAWQPFVRGITPTAISDITDAVAYGTDFLGRPINNMTEFNENLPEYQRMSKYTPGWVHELAKQVHNATGRPNERTWVDAWTFNPSNLYYIATQQFGGVGTFAGKVGTMGAWGYDAIVGNPTDDYEAKQFPVVSKVINFGRDDRSRMRVVRDKYYNYLREYEASNAEVNKNRKDYQEGKMSFNEYTEAMNAFAESGGAKRYMIMRNGSKAVRKMQKYLGMIDRKENPEQWKEANEKLFELQKQIVHAIEGK